MKVFILLSICWLYHVSTATPLDYLTKQQKRDGLNKRYFDSIEHASEFGGLDKRRNGDVIEKSTEECGLYTSELAEAFNHMVAMETGGAYRSASAEDLQELFAVFGWDIHNSEDMYAAACFVSNLETMDQLTDKMVDKSWVPYAEMMTRTVKRNLRKYAEDIPSMTAAYKPVYEVLKKMYIMKCGLYTSELAEAFNHMVAVETGGVEVFASAGDLQELFAVFGWDIHNSEDMYAAACFVSNLETMDQLTDKMVDKSWVPYAEIMTGAVHK